MKAKKFDPKIISQQPAEKKPLAQSANLFPVVGIGASAGGLDAFKKLLKAIPENSGMAYVLVQHLDPNHESMLPEILQKVTKIPVLEISNDIKVEPNHIYVIPSNKMMVATDGVLLLAPRPAKSKTERNLPIDLFFASLAEVHQEHAIGVVLSGTACDGTQGLRAIKDNGGITFAQDEASAEYDGMPHSAAQAGVVDFILPPGEIPKKLLEVTNKIRLSDDELQNIPKQDEDVFMQILSLLRIRKGVDFTYYKQTTIRRRILRRMVINKNEDPACYLKFLRSNTPEQDLLYQDMLIPVTSFFRDKKIFDNLCNNVFPTILKNKIPGEITRIWVAGCSTGQEVYSFAICFKEFLDNNHEKIQIFGTDLSEPAITKARAGIYEKTELDSVSPQQLKEYFTKNNGGYQINKNIRDMCVFAHHNFLKDPPFGKMDCISCRNVLIYMEPYLQKKALTTFHYALNPKGFLLLGKSETTGGVPDLFAGVEKKEKLYTRKDVPGRFMQVASQRSEQILNHSRDNYKNETNRTDFQKTADDILLSKYTPGGVVVNETMDIVHFRGNTANFLEQAPGKPSHNLLMMAKHGLGFELRNILHKAKTDKVPVVKNNIPLSVNGSLRNISIEALPLPNTLEPYYLVLFHDNNVTDTDGSVINNLKKVSAKTKKEEKDIQIQLLEHELAQAREDMRSITEEQEAANEELQSANEELLSSSEELQSLNEELETSKEELQSTNEELTVLNHELIGLNEQVTDAKKYSESIVTTLYQPLLVLDKNLRVKTANEAFYKTFKVNEEETEGVLIYDLGNRQWNIPQLHTLLEEILPQKKQITDFEVTHNFLSIGERIILLSALELPREKKEEKLILLSIEDVTENRRAEEKLRVSEQRFRILVEHATTPICILKGENMVIDLANESILKVWGVGDEAIGKTFLEIIPEMKDQPFMGYLDGVYKTGVTYFGHEEPAYFIRKNGETETGYYNFVYQPYREDDKIIGVMALATDVTEPVIARKKIEESEKRKAFLLKLSDAVRLLSDPVDIEEAVTKIALDFMDADWCHYATIEEDNLIISRGATRDGLSSVVGVYPISSFALFKEVLSTGIPCIVDDVHTSDILDEELKQQCMQLQNIAFVIVPIIKNDKPVGLLVLVQSKPRKWTDSEVQLTIETAERTWAAVERAKAVEALRQSEEKYRSLFYSIDEGVSTIEIIFDENEKAVDFRFLESNLAMTKATGLTNEINGKTAKEVLPNIEEFWLETYGRVVKTGEPIRFEYTSIDLNSNWFDVHAYNVGDKQSRKIVTVYSNITERKEREERQLYILKLSDAIKELVNPVDIQLTACRILGEHVKASRVLYSEVINEELLVINNNYVNGVSPIIGTIPVNQFGQQVIDALKRNEKIIFNDINTDDRYNEDEKQSFLSLDVVANAGMGLVKGGRWVSTLGMHYNAPRKWTAMEILLMEETAERTWAAVERGKAVEALRKNEEKYHSLFNSIDQGFALCEVVRNKEGKGIDYLFLEVNPNYEKHSGIRTEMALGKTVREIFPMIDELHISTYVDVVDNQCPAVFEHYFENTHRWFSINAYPSEKDRFAILFSDITERKQAEEKIKESEARFRKMADLMPQKVWTADVEGNYNYFNKCWYDYTGLAFKELKEWGWKKVIHPEDWEETKAKWQVSINTGENFEMEHRLINTRGLYKWHLSRGLLQNEEFGNKKIWVGTNTEMHHIKEEEERKGNFIKMISHELKTPVTSIKGHVQTLLMMLDDKKVTVTPMQIISSLIRVDKQILNLTRLIYEMLDLTRIEAGNLQFKMEIFSLNNLIDEIKDDILVTKPKYVIELHHDFSASIFADRDRIGQVLINFINNGIKYSPESNRIVIRIYKSGKDNVSVSVKDFGIGISKEEQQKIFERFYRVGGKNEQTFPGFGIGLFIAHSIIEKHHGTVVINSEINKGSEFIFTLNIAPQNNL